MELAPRFLLGLMVVMRFMTGHVTERSQIGLLFACIDEEKLKAYTYRTDSSTDKYLNISSIFRWRQVESNELFLIHKTVADLQGTRSCLIFTRTPSKYFQSIFSTFQIQFVKFDKLASNLSTSLIDLCDMESRHNDAESCDTNIPSFGEFGFPVTNKISSLGNSIAATIVDRLKWKSVMIFFELDMEDEIDELSSVLSNFGTIVRAYVFLKNNTEIHHQDIHRVADWSKPTELQIIAICHSNCSEMLHMMNTYDTSDPLIRSMRHFSAILVINTGKDIEEDLFQSSLQLDNVVLISVPRTRYNEITLKEIEVVIYNFLRNMTSSRSLDSANLSSLLMSRFTKFQETKICEWFAIKTLMWKSMGRYLDIVGHVNINGSVIFLSKLYPNKEYGCNGRHFEGTTMELTPFINRFPNGSYYGLAIDIFNEIAKRFNFTYDLSLPPDGQWGTGLDNGSWTGAVGQLQRKEKAFAVTSLTVHSLREQVIDFTYPFYYDYSTIAVRKLSQNDSKWRTLIDPFDQTVLLCIGLVLVSASVCLYYLEKINPFYSNATAIDNRMRFMTYQHVLWYLFGALLTQGGHRLPFSQTGRTFLGCWWLFCIVTMATYTGNLIAFLTVSKDKLPFDNIADMIKQDKYTWGTIGGTYFITLFKESQMIEFKAIWSGIQKYQQTDPSVLSMELEEHFQKVLSEDYVFIGDKMSIELKMANECSLVAGKEEILPFMNAFGLPNHSPFTTLFSNEMIEIHESGLLHIWEHRQWPRQTRNCESTYTAGKAITLVDVQSAFYLIAIGILLALIVFLCETLFHHQNSSKRRQTENVEVKNTI